MVIFVIVTISVFAKIDYYWFMRYFANATDKTTHMHASTNNKLHYLWFMAVDNDEMEFNPTVQIMSFFCLELLSQIHSIYIFYVLIL